MQIRELRGGLIVSVQAWSGSAIDRPDVIAAMARAAADNGAAALRIDGPANISAVQRRTTIPIVGIYKRMYEGFDTYITPTVQEVTDVAAAGASIVAFDATLREHPERTTVGALIDAIHEHSLLAMADCATLEDARWATAAGAEIVATTLCGYTEETRGTELPALDLVREMRALDAFVICEGGIATPEQAAAAFAAGADAIVVGTAITNVDALVQRFVAATPNQQRRTR